MCDQNFDQNFVNKKDSAVFVVISDFHCTYMSFRDSFKASWFVSDDVMSLFAQLFNFEYKQIPDSRVSTKKVALSPFLALLFPVCIDKHWILLCINQLNKKVQCLSSTTAPFQKQRYILMDNLATNFQNACKLAVIYDRQFNLYDKDSPICPKQSNIFDCGIYVMLFMEHFNGKCVRQFIQDTAT